MADAATIQSPEEWLASQQHAPATPAQSTPAAAPAPVPQQHAVDVPPIYPTDPNSPEAWALEQQRQEQANKLHPPQPEASALEKLKGGAEAALNAVSGMTSGALGLAGGFIGAELGRLHDYLKHGDVNPQEAGNMVEDIATQYQQALTVEPKSKVGREYAKNLAEFGQNYIMPLGPMAADLQPVTESAAMVPGAVKAAVKGEKATSPATEAATTETIAGVTPKIPSPEPMTETPKTFVEKTVSNFKSMAISGKKQLAQDIKNDPYNADYAPYEVKGNVAKVSKPAEEALKQGWRPGFVQSVKISDATDMSAYRKMLNILKIGKKNERFRAEHRPADVVGDTFENRVNQLFNIKKQSINELNNAASKLKGTSVDYKPAIDDFVKRLEDEGVTVTKNEKGGYEFSLDGSMMEDDVASETLLKKVFKRIGKTDSADGHSLHIMKRWLSEQVKYGKKSQTGLSGITEGIVKGLRSNINEALREKSPAYKAANIKYQDSLTSLEDVQKAVGSTKDITGEYADKTLGQEARVLLSKYGKRNNMLKAIKQAEDTVKKYGGEVKGDIMGQVIFANEIDHMFGDVAEGSMRSMLQKAGETGLEAAKKDKANLAIDLIKGGYKKMRGINEENAIKAMQDLISAKPKKK